MECDKEWFRNLYKMSCMKGILLNKYLFQELIREFSDKGIAIVRIVVNQIDQCSTMGIFELD